MHRRVRFSSHLTIIYEEPLYDSSANSTGWQFKIHLLPLSTSAGDVEDDTSPFQRWTKGGVKPLHSLSISHSISPQTRIHKPLYQQNDVVSSIPRSTASSRGKTSQPRRLTAKQGLFVALAHFWNGQGGRLPTPEWTGLRLHTFGTTNDPSTPLSSLPPQNSEKQCLTPNHISHTPIESAYSTPNQLSSSFAPTSTEQLPSPPSSPEYGTLPLDGNPSQKVPASKAVALTRIHVPPPPGLPSPPLTPTSPYSTIQRTPAALDLNRPLYSSSDIPPFLNSHTKYSPSYASTTASSVPVFTSRVTPPTPPSSPPPLPFTGPRQDPAFLAVPVPYKGRTAVSYL